MITKKQVREAQAEINRILQELSRPGVNVLVDVIRVDASQGTSYPFVRVWATLEPPEGE